jgi:thiol-disulfide isomerase/thioredoxin
MRRCVVHAALVACAALWIAATSLHAAGEIDDRAAMGEALVAWQGVTPALSLKDAQGVTHSLSELRGQVVLVHFWASWCEPCRDEIPQLSGAVRRYAQQGLRLVAVNVGESRSGIARFVAQVPIAGLVLEDRDSETPPAWRTHILPASYLIGRDGQMRYWHLGALDWHDRETIRRVEALLAAPANSGGRQQESNLPGNG